MATFVYKSFIRKRLDLTERYGKASWVLVTGATDGLGKEYCIQFAKLGFNIILVSRTLKKLEAVQSEIKEQFPNAKTALVEFDFSTKTTVSDYEQAFSKLQEKHDISVLVNNVGMGSRGFFTEYTNEYVRDMVNVSILSPALLTKIIINGMEKRSKRSAIISLSSFASTSPMLQSSIYSATKVFNDYLSRAIGSELLGKNIDMLSVRPLYVATPLTRMKAKEFSVINTEQSVTGTLNSLGQDKITNGHWIHSLQNLLLSYVSEDWRNYMRLRTVNKAKVEAKIRGEDKNKTD